MGPAGLAGLLTGSIVSGSALAVMLSNAGGAWDNTKKFIEAGAHGGKGSDNHKVRQCAAMTVCYGIGSRVYNTAKVLCMVHTFFVEIIEYISATTISSLTLDTYQTVDCTA